MMSALHEVQAAPEEITESFVLIFRSAGGFGADFTQNSLLAKYRPDLLHLPTTNGEHCTGDGIKMGEARPRVNCEGRRSRGLVCSCSWRQERCQVGGTALAGDRGEDHRPGVGAGPPDRPREAGRRGRQDQVPSRRGPAHAWHQPGPGDPLRPQHVHVPACQALRGVGGIILNAEGERFCNELGRHGLIRLLTVRSVCRTQLLRAQAATTSPARCGRASLHSGPHACACSCNYC